MEVAPMTRSHFHCFNTPINEKRYYFRLLGRYPKLYGFQDEKGISTKLDLPNEAFYVKGEIALGKK
jgi:hypothetical protein